MPETREMQHDSGQLLLSRRQILTGTTYAVGATLLFHHVTRSRVDPIDRIEPQPRPPHPVPATSRPQHDDTTPGGAGGDGASAASGPSAASGREAQPVVRRAIHRAQLADHGRPRSVCKGSAGVLVLGVSADGEPLGWLTEDGTRWLEHTFATPERLTADVWAVTAYGGQFIAVGSTTERDVRHIAESGIVPGVDNRVTYTGGRRSPAVWSTTDLTTWSGRTLDDVVDSHAHLIAVGSHEGRLVAVGSTLDSDGAQGAEGLIMTSTDGVSWQRAELGDEARLDEGSFTGVTADADGRWFATSVDIDGGAVWTSRDAQRWSVIPGSRRVLRGTAPQGIGSDGRRLLMAGTHVVDPRPRYYVSRSGGRRWRAATLDVSMLAGPDAVIGDLSVIAGDVVVVGTYRDAPVLEGGQLHVAD